MTITCLIAKNVLQGYTIEKDVALSQMAYSENRGRQYS